MTAPDAARRRGGRGWTWTSADSRVFLAVLAVTGLSLAGLWGLMVGTAAMWPGPIDLEIFGFTANVARDGSSSVGVSASALLPLLVFPVGAVLVRKFRSWQR